MSIYLNGEEGFCYKTLIKKLIEQYADDIIITTSTGKPSLVCLRTTADKILESTPTIETTDDDIERNEKKIENSERCSQDSS